MTKPKVTSRCTLAKRTKPGALATDVIRLFLCGVGGATLCFAIFRFSDGRLDRPGFFLGIVLAVIFLGLGLFGKRNDVESI